MPRDLQDQDPMPFGKHKGKRMEEVPADYLHYLWTELDFRHQDKPVAKYIRKNLNVLRIEFENGIWED